MWLLIETHRGENGTESRIPVCHHSHDGGDTEAEKTSCLFCNRTSSVAKFLRDVHHITVTPWKSKVSHKKIKTLFGRDCWWPSNPTSWSIWDCRLHQAQLWGWHAARDESPEPQQAGCPHAEHPSKEETHLLSKPCRKGSVGPMLGLNQTYEDDSPGVLLLVSRDTDFPLFDIMLLLYNPL